MATRLCWKCDVKAHMTLLTSSITQVESDGSIAVVAPYTCDECGFMSIGIGVSDKRIPSGVEKWTRENVVEWLPVHGAGQAFPDVPPHIAEAASEATRCHSIAAYRASILLARSVIEASAKDKGITKGMLMTKIDEMEKRGLIRAHIKDAAHEIRYLGNSMAHGDFVDPITEEESEETLELMSEVLNEVFQSLAKIARRTASRQAKKAAAGGV